MIYDIRLTISHKYAQPAGNGQHLIRVAPRAIQGQQMVTANLTEVLPLPSQRQDRQDFFGNAVTAVSHRDPHDEMTIRLTARVAITAPEAWLNQQTTLALLQDELSHNRDLTPRSPLHFLGPSPRLNPIAQIANFAQDCFDPSDNIASNVVRIGKALHATMTFDPDATTVDTDPGEAFAQRRGVCQDLSHIMILALRSLGIPAGYVSGYLRTLPPEGQMRLEGADAMHAWVQAWCGIGQGWIAYDPTNATLVGTDHIVAAVGRDYADVSPVIGHLRSSGHQVNTQSVDVVCVDESNF